MKKTILTFLSMILVIALLFISSALSYEKEELKTFKEQFSATFQIPDLENGFVPQGITYIESEDIFLICGYMHKEKSASRIYLVKEEAYHKIELYLDKNTPYYGHTGGISAGSSLVWLANDGDVNDNCIWTLSLDEILDPSTSTIYLENYFVGEGRSSTCYVYDGYLWVGEYADEYSYTTKESHHLTDNNPSLILAYKIDETKENGIVSTTPEKILSVRNHLQGFAFDENSIYLSTSCGLDNSILEAHENDLNKEADTSLLINNTNVPVWILDTSSKQYEITMPPMSEEMTFKKNDLYIMFESASNKYIFGKFFKQDYIYAF